MDKKNIITVITIIALILLAVLLFFFMKKPDDTLEKAKEQVSFLFEGESISPEDDIFSIQNKTDELINTAKKNSKYTFDEPYVLKNPYKIAPLSALIIFRTGGNDDVTVTINEKTTTFKKNKEQAIPIYGLIAGKQNEITLKMKDETKKITIDTTDVKNEIPYEVIKKDKIRADGIYIVTTPSEDGIFGFDDNGNLVWRLTEPFSLAITELENGHLLLSDSNYLSISFSRKGLVEIDYLGKIYNAYDIEGGYHHDAIELENGNILLASSKPNRLTTTDYVIEIDRKNGKIVNSWDLFEIMSEIDASFIEGLNTESWAFNNSLYYDKDTKSILLSLRGRNSIVSLDYDTKKINWIFANPSNWSKAFEKYLIKTDDPKDYPIGAHSASLTKTKELILFNNNFSSAGEMDAPCAPYKDNVSSGLIYKLDIEKKTAEKVFEFNDNNTLFSYAVSNFMELENGNLLLDSAWELPREEYQKEGCTMNAAVNNLHSLIYELDKEGNILYKAKFNSGTYRVNKLSLYKETNESFTPEQTKIFNTMDEKIYDELTTSDILEQLRNASKEEYNVDITKTLISINAIFPPSDEVSLLMVSDNTNTYKYLIKKKDSKLQTSVNLKGLKGKYAAFLLINDTYINLNKTYQFPEK